MLYIFPPNILSGGDESPFVRYYLSSDTYLQIDHKTTLNSPGGQEPISSVAAESLKSEVKLTLRGTRVPYLGWDLHKISSPWPASAIEFRKAIPGLKASIFSGMGAYFYRRRIGIFGGPGAGKTCLARAMANYLSIHRGIIADTPYESASTFISRYGKPTLHDQVWLLLEQWRREEDISLHKSFMISDSPHPLSYLYASDPNLPKGAEDLKYLPWLQEMALRGMRAFDIRIYLPFNPNRCIRDGIRIHDPEEAKEISDRILAWLRTCGSFITFQGDLDQLPELVAEILEENPRLPQ